jgi:hypothetical protein
MIKDYSVTKYLKLFLGVTVREEMKREDVRETEKVEDHVSKGRATRQ